MVRFRYVWLAVLTRQRREFWSYRVSKRIPTFGLLTSYFVWCRFALVTVGCACLLNVVWNNTIENSWGVNWIPRLSYEEYTIRWFHFYLCSYLNLRDREESFEASQSVKDYLPLGCWLHILSGNSLHLWLLGVLVYLNLLGMTPLKTVDVQTEYLDNLRVIYNP